MKKILALLLALVMALGLLACGAEEASAEVPQSPAEETAPAEPQPQETAEPEGPQKVALITASGTVKDAGVQEAAWEGVQEYCVANGVSHRAFESEADTDNARMAAVQEAWDGGFDVLVLSGEAFGPMLEKIETRFPEAWIIALRAETETPGSRTVCVTYAREQAVFLEGYGAVKEGFTRLGVLSSADTPEARANGFNFVQGAEAAAAELGMDPEQITVYFLCGLPEAQPEDPAAELQPEPVTLESQMENWFDEGISLIFLCGDPVTGDLVESAKLHGRRLMGVDVSQKYLGMREEDSYCAVTATTVENLTDPVVEVLTDLFAGDFALHGGSIWHLSVTDGGVGLITEQALWGFRNFTRSDYEKAAERLAAGDLTATQDLAQMPAVTAMTVITTFEPEQ